MGDYNISFVCEEYWRDYLLYFIVTLATKAMQQKQRYLHFSTYAVSFLQIPTQNKF